MHLLFTILYWIAYLVPIWINAYICLASYVYNRRIMRQMRAERELLRVENDID